MGLLGLLVLLAGALGLTAALTDDSSSNGDDIDDDVLPDDGDTGGDTDGDTGGDTDGDTGGDADGDTGGDADGDTGNDTDGDTDGDADGDTDGDITGDADGDIGATFEYDEETDIVTIDVGEDETRDLVTIIKAGKGQDVEYDDETKRWATYLSEYKALYYLVPKGSDWPEGGWEQSGGFEINGDSIKTFEEFEDYFDMELLGSVDLMPNNKVGLWDIFPPPDNMSEPLPVLNANVTEDIYFLHGNTNHMSSGTNIQGFLQENYQVTQNGTPLERITSDTKGSENDDYLIIVSDNVTVDANDGNDLIYMNGKDVTLYGGEGNDRVSPIPNYPPYYFKNTAETDVNRAPIDDDDVNLTAYGGAGDDTIRIPGEGVKIYGEAGDDFVSVSGEGSEASAGIGNDTVGSSDGGIAYGDAGNDIVLSAMKGVGYGGEGADTLFLSGGAIGNGEAGDDILRAKIGELSTDYGPVSMTGGTGNDAFQFYVRPYVGFYQSDNYSAFITDFNVNEDRLEVLLRSDGDDDGGDETSTATFGVDDLQIIEADDRTYTDIYVKFNVASFDNEKVDGSYTVRVDGVVGLTKDHIKFVKLQPSGKPN